MIQVVGLPVGGDLLDEAVDGEGGAGGVGLGEGIVDEFAEGFVGVGAL